MTVVVVAWGSRELVKVALGAVSRWWGERQAASGAVRLGAVALAEEVFEAAEEGADVKEGDKAKEEVYRGNLYAPPAIERPFSLLQPCHHDGRGVETPRFCRMPTIR